MATVAELQQQLAQAEQRYQEAQQRVVSAEAELAALRQAANSSNFQPLDNPDNLAAFKAARARATDFQNGELNQLQLAEGEAFRAARDLRQQVQQAEQQASIPTGPTAAAEVTADQTNNPNTPPPEIVTPNGTVITPVRNTQPTTAVITPTADTGDVDSGTDAPVRTLEQTQAPVNRPLGQGVQRDEDGNMIIEITGVGDTGANDDIEGGAVGGVISTGATADDIAQPSRMVATERGVGANDDVTELDPVVVTAQREAEVRTITPKGNVLDRFHNYTYNASVYVLSPEQFAAYQLQPKKTISGYNLLFQSGGAATGSGVERGAAAGRADSNIQDNRNPAFPLDYYIDSIQIEHLILGRATQAAHGVTNLKFTVVEPGNISLLDNMYRAVQDLNPELSGRVNYAAAIYLMVIRFYGYDLDGRPVRVGAAADTATQTDPDAVVEKFIPFRIRQINWTVSNQLVNYQFEGVAVGQIIAAATRRGTIPADVQISGATVQEMLSGDPVYSSQQAPNSAPGAGTTALTGQPQTDPSESPATVSARLPQAPPKATGAGNKSASLISGIMGAMNSQQQELLNRKIIEVADEYEIVFGPGAEKIASATTTKPGTKVAKDRTAGAVPVSKGNTSSASPDKQGMDVTSRNFAIPAGTQLLQVIDQIIRNSSYITDQATEVVDEKANQPKGNPKGDKQVGVQWFNVLMQATPIKYDAKRNDYAFRIRYLIVPYDTQDFYSQYFPVPRYRGLHKSYPYWFTGENTQVLDYQASFNKLFTITVSGGPGSNPLQQFRELYTSSMRDYPFVQSQARSTESDVGADGRANEVAANAAEYLYNPSDNAQGKLRILGDPAWIQQGTATGIADPATYTTDAFGPDGTINFDAQDVLFEIAWQRPEDYSQDTGLADPYARTQASFRDREPIQSVIYRARKCTSYFNQGRFEQDLEGTLYWFPLPDGRNRAPGAQATVSSADNATGSGREPAVAASTGRITTAADSSGSTVANLTEAAKLQTGSLGLKLPADITKPSVAFTSGQFTFPDTATLGLPPVPGLPTSDGASVGAGTGSAGGRELTTAELIAQANERNRLNDVATAARRRYEQVLAANDNDRSNPAVEAAFAEFQQANRAANAALNDTGVSGVSAGPRQQIARET